ncbi:MAG: XisI protein [Saprospiraceae bacterium]
MDKIESYQKILTQLLEEIAARPYANAPEIEQQILIDFQRKHFQLINIGWHRGRYIFNPLLHFDLRDGKVWVQQNDTELEIGDELAARGIAPTDIVFGFIPENERDLVKIAA